MLKNRLFQENVWFFPKTRSLTCDGTQRPTDLSQDGSGDVVPVPNTCYCYYSPPERSNHTAGELCEQMSPDLINDK